MGCKSDHVIRRRRQCWVKSFYGFLLSYLAATASSASIWPELPAEYAGLIIDSGDAWVEIAAMYGGLQTAFGVFCLLGALRSDLYRPALISIVLVSGRACAGAAVFHG